MIYSEETPIFADIKVRIVAHACLVWPEMVDLDLESITNISYSNDFFGGKRVRENTLSFFPKQQATPQAHLQCLTP